jgi:hypothetical protein
MSWSFCFYDVNMHDDYVCMSIGFFMSWSFCFYDVNMHDDYVCMSIGFFMYGLFVSMM